MTLNVSFYFGVNYTRCKACSLIIAHASVNFEIIWTVKYSFILHITFKNDNIYAAYMSIKTPFIS